MDTSQFEHAFYAGNFLGAILYGFELVIYFMILRALFHKGNKNTPLRRRFCAIYSTVMLLLSTIPLSCNAVWGSEMWITHREGPGGVPGYIQTHLSVWYQTLASSSVIAGVFLGDALLLYRLFVVYGRLRSVIAVPLLAYLVAFGLAVLQVVLSGLPNGNFFGNEISKIGVSYYSITICLNIVVTILICARLFRISNVVADVLGREKAKVYTSVAAILVESAAPYSLLGIMYLIPYGLKSPLAILFGQLWTKMSVIAPLLILLRVVNGSAWRDDVMTRPRTPLAFASTRASTTVDVCPLSSTDDTLKGEYRTSHIHLKDLSDDT
ncbi:hypothetical protein B0H34DRAFT_645238 [Crassisporium funariophilum]|nr:hypothetical protein B0H34DRAFT_645238 [Crassisporium funariophilum]